MASTVRHIATDSLLSEPSHLERKCYIKDLLHACNHYHFSNCRSTVNVNLIMHLPVSYKLTCIDKFMYIRACLGSSINTCMLITPKHGHIVAMGMTLLQLPNSLSSTQLTLEVLSIKHWHQSAFTEMPATAGCQYISIYLYIYHIIYYHIMQV